MNEDTKVMDMKVDINDEDISSSSVPASAFGWDFQVNAAIVLMLTNIKQANSVKVEGATDDIEIYMNNGNVIYSQAKSVFDRDNFNPVIKNLEKSLKSLHNDSLQPNVEQLVYITNSPNPFGAQTTMYAFSSGMNMYNYIDLPEPCKKKIDGILKKYKYTINTSKLSVCVLQFSKDQNNRYKVIKEIANELINSLDLGVTDIGNDMLNIWQNEFFHNTSAPLPNITIRKSEMLWPLIVFMCELKRDDENIKDFDNALYEEIARKYKSIIDSKSERFSFAVRVITSFSEYDVYNKNTRERISSFIESYWTEYENEFNFHESENDIKENVIKITLSNILHTRRKIKKIKQEVNL